MNDLIFWFIAIDILDNIKLGLSVSFIIVGLLSVFRGIYNFVERPEYKYNLKNPTILATILFTVMLFIPSSKTLYIALGLSTGNKAFEQIAESKYAEQIKYILDYKLNEMVQQIKGDSNGKN